MEVLFVMDGREVVLDQEEAEALLPHLSNGLAAESAADKIRHALREGGDVQWTRAEKSAVNDVASQWRVDGGSADTEAGLLLLHAELVRDLESSTESS